MLSFSSHSRGNKLPRCEYSSSPLKRPITNNHNNLTLANSHVSEFGSGSSLSRDMTTAWLTSWLHPCDRLSQRHQAKVCLDSLFTFYTWGTKVLERLSNMAKFRYFLIHIMLILKKHSHKIKASMVNRSITGWARYWKII